MAQMQTLSIRIPDDDFHWLLSLDMDGAKTPSEKLRAILARNRQLDTGLTHPETCAAWLRELSRPLADAITARERQSNLRSDILAAAFEWVPRIMASLVAVSPAIALEDTQAQEIEAMLAQQCFRLLATLLRVGITSTPATYDRHVLDKYIAEVSEIAAIISTIKGKESHHG
jgi:hypothetical protein